MVQRVLTHMFRFKLFSQPRTGTTSATVTTPRARRAGESGRRVRHDAAEEQACGAAGILRRLHRRGPARRRTPSPAYAGGGSAYVLPSGTVSPLAGIKAAAGSGTSVAYQQGLPADTSLPAIPAADCSPAYAAHAVRRQLCGHPHRAGDRHLRAGHHQPVRLLHLDVPVPGRQADHRRPVHASGAHVLGRGAADRREDVQAVDQRRLLAAAVGHVRRPLAPGIARRGFRGQVGVGRRGSWCPTTPSPRPRTGRR